jgi:tRNA modification GTPase
MNSPLSESETYVACLTPGGTGAIATLGVRGPRAWQTIQELFHPHSQAQRLPGEPVLGSIWLGQMGVDLTDQVVLTAKAAQPIPWLEIHCHGGREVIRLLQQSLEARGVRACSWQQLACLTETDATRAAAVTALANALTVRTAAILLDQYQGAFGRAIETIVTAWDEGRPEKAGQLLRGLYRQANLGRHLLTPWRVVVAGAPNVGKSSLVNALAGFQRCVVAATPGTTRDVVTTRIAIDGWPVELADTAGLREADELLEEHGIGRAREAVTEADLCLWVLDASAPPVWPNLPSDRLRLVVNKVDLPTTWNLDRAQNAIHMSARTGEGLEELCAMLSQGLVADPPPQGSAVPFTPWLCDRVEEAWELQVAARWDQARQALNSLVSQRSHLYNSGP